MGFSWRKTFKIKQTRKSKCLSAFDVEHAQCLTGYHVFMVSGLDLARAPRRRRLTARKKGSGYENVFYGVPVWIIPGLLRAISAEALGTRLEHHKFWCFPEVNALCCKLKMLTMH